MALPDLTGQNIENTYQRVIQTDGTDFYDGTGSLVNFGEAVFPYTGSAIISGSLIVTGSTEIQYLTASGLNYPTIDGDEKQLITTDGSGNLSFDWSDRTNLDVKNASGTTLALGTPVYISGFQGASIFQIAPSSASISSSMPAVGVLSQELAPNEQGHATILGALRGYNTSLCSVNNSLYVGEGILTKDRPTGSALIQKIARVGNSQNNGEITIIGAGRSNDIPNLPPGYAWVGNDNWVATAVPTSSFNEDPFPYTGSAAISGALEVTGDVTIYGTASVNVLVTNYESSSIIYSSGSTKFGDSLDDTHQFTGSVSVEGGITTTDNITIPRGKSLIFPTHPTLAGGISIGDSFTTDSVGANFIRIGNSAGTEASSNKFIAIGDEAGRSATGQQQIFIGFRAGRGFDNSNNVVVIGNFAAWGDFSNADVDNAVILGTNAGTAVTQTDNVVIIGTNAGYNTEYSSKSVIIGDQAGYNHSGSSGDVKEGNVFIGYQAGYNELGSNKLIIANTGSKALVTGDFENNTFNISGSVSASTYYGDGSNLTGIDSGSWDGIFTGSAEITGSLEVTGSISSTDTVTAVTGSFSHLKGNSPITVQDPVTFQHTQGLDVLGNATIHSINEVELQTISKDFNYTSSLVVTEITASVNGAIIDYRLTNLNSGSRVGTFMYAHDGTELSYNDLTIPGGGIGDQPILSASLANNLVTINIENAAGFNFTGYAKKFNRLGAPIPVANPNLPTPLLDTYSGAEAAFSLRKLSTPYTGSAIRIRENGSNTEIDIGFDVNNNLDTTALAAHCGSNNGFVVTWYDQSGNGNDATQTTTANQPKIYDSVTGVVMENGNPAVEFDGSSTVLSVTATSISSFPFTIVDVASISGVRGAPVSLFTASNKHFSHLFMSNEGNKNAITSRNTSFQRPGITNAPLNTQLLSYLDYTSQSSVTIYQNNSTNASGVSQPIFTPAEILIGRLGYGTPADYLQGKLQEAIIYNSSQNRTGIESNINDYYDVYDTGLLAEYSGAATAYSVRLLHSVYTGSALRIREDGTNTETDIGFDSNGDLNTASIASHCGANNGLVVTWYDQSGNGNDATQSTVGNQPKIYDSSTGIELENGKPIINLITGNSSTLLLDTQLTSSTTHIFGVAELDSTGNKVMIGVTNGGGLYIAANGDTNNASVGSELYINSSSSTISTRDQVSDQFQTQTLFSSIQNLSSAGHDQTRIGMLNGGGDSYKMFNMQEIIFYNTSQSVDRDGIHNNINSYFNIYS